jgi:hypothetical protein
MTDPTIDYLAKAYIGCLQAYGIDTQTVSIIPVPFRVPSRFPSGNTRFPPFPVSSRFHPFSAVSIRFHSFPAVPSF